MLAFFWKIFALILMPFVHIHFVPFSFSNIVCKFLHLGEIFNLAFFRMVMVLRYLGDWLVL